MTFGHVVMSGLNREMTFEHVVMAGLNREMAFGHVVMADLNREMDLEHIEMPYFDLEMAFEHIVMNSLTTEMTIGHIDMDDCNHEMLSIELFAKLFFGKDVKFLELKLKCIYLTPYPKIKKIRMNKHQESEIRKGRAVSGILSGFEDIVKTIPALSNAHLELDKYIEEAMQYSQGQFNTGTDLTRKKDEAREILEKAVIKISAAMAAFATASIDETIKALKAEFQKNDSEIKHLRDMQLFLLAYKVYGDVLPFAAQLAPFATADEVTGLKTKADTFNELLPQRRAKLGTSVLSTQNLNDTITKMHNLIVDTIDVLLKPLEYTEPVLFKSYQNAKNTD